MKTFCLIAFLISLFCIRIYCQEDRIEFIAEKASVDLDFTELTMLLDRYREQPLDLNLAGVEEILSLQILDPLQVHNFIEYREKYGALLTVYELLAIEGFNKDLLAQLMPFVAISPGSTLTSGQEKPGSFRYQMITRYSRVLEKQQGYRDIAVEEWQARPNDRYIGPPDRLYMRNDLVWKERYRMGFLVDKDAGEPFTPNNLPDTIQHFMQGNWPVFPDFFSAHACVDNLSIIKKLIVGDYHLQFGQGLSMWSGMSYGKSADVTNVKRYGPMIRPNTSANENSYMRGGAAWLRVGSFDLLAFYSNHRVDANIAYSEEDSLQNQLHITSLLESGYHRTLNEQLDRHTMRIISFGGRILGNFNKFKLGLAAHRTTFDIPMIKQEQLHDLFQTGGSEFICMGADWDALLFKKINLFGEIATDRNLSVAFITGLISMLHPKLSFSMVYRNYARAFTDLLGHSFSESGHIQNEKGFYMGVALNPLPKITLKAYADFFRFPWLRYGAGSPSSGYDMLAQVNYTLSPAFQVYFRYRTETKHQNNTAAEAYTNTMTDKSKHNIRLHLTCQVSASLQLRSRIEWTRSGVPPQTGMLIFQDVVFRPVDRPHQLTARIAIFDTDSYQSRVYAYENDVLYASTVPSYFGQGTRIYVIYNLQLTKYVGLWFRLAQTYYYDRNIIGTGLDEIYGRTRTELKAQVRIRF